jgi:hypothetical protein
MEYKEHNMKYEERSISYVSFFLRAYFFCSKTIISLALPSKELSVESGSILNKHGNSLS